MTTEGGEQRREIVLRPVPDHLREKPTADEASGFQPRIDPQALFLMMLDTLESINRNMEEEKGTGRQRMYEYSADGPSQVDVEDSTYNWISATIKNDGPDDVFYSTNTSSEDLPSRLKKNEQMDIFWRKPIGKIIYFWCNPGETSQGRVYGLI